MYSYGPPHMAGQKQDDQHEHTFSRYMRIRDVALKTYQRRWTIGRSGERGSGTSVSAARHDDDEFVLILILLGKLIHYKIRVVWLFLTFPNIFPKIVIIIILKSMIKYWAKRRAKIYKYSPKLIFTSFISSITSQTQYVVSTLNDTTFLIHLRNMYFLFYLFVFLRQSQF